MIYLNYTVLDNKMIKGSIMKIYLVRHGETPWNKEGKIQGRSNTKLNEFGVKLAQITGEALKDVPFEVVYSSPLDRAKETAEIIKGKRQIPLYTDERIIEMSFGAAEGADIPEAKRNPENPLYNFLHKPQDYIPAENGETFEDLYKRSNEFMEQVLIPAEKKYENILVVAHGALNRSLLNQMGDIPLNEFWRIQLRNCCVSEIELKDGKFTITEEGKLYYDEVHDTL